MNLPTGRRLPPPPQLRADDPASLIQGMQWLIDRVFHLDECLDETKDSLTQATKGMLDIKAWQDEKDEADIKDAAARAERRRLFHYGYLFYDVLNQHGWQLVGIGAVVYALVKQ